MNSGLDLVALNTFVVVGDTGGFRTAAEALGMTPSGVSKAIARLEKRIGTRLIARTTRSVQLTPTGGAFHNRCKEILRELSQAEIEATGNALPSHDKLCISVPLSYGREIVLPIITEFCAEYRNIQVEARFDDAYSRLVEDGIDLAVRIGESPGVGILATRASSITFACCASPDYLVRNSPPAHPSEIRKHTCVDTIAAGAQERSAWKFIVNNEMYPVSPTSRLTVSNQDALIVAAMHGTGLIYSHRFLVEDAMTRRTLVPVLKEFLPPPVPVWIVRSPARTASTSVRRLAEFIQLRLHDQRD